MSSTPDEKAAPAKAAPKTDPKPPVGTQTHVAQQNNAAIQSPSLGRIVIFVDGVQRERAAIVAKVLDEKAGVVALQVFEQEAYGSSLYTHVGPQSTDPVEEDVPVKPYWKWPERK